MQRKHNFERPLVFARTMLEKTRFVHSNKDIRARLDHHMTLWEKGCFEALVDDTVAEASQRGPSAAKADEESEARAFDTMVHAGRLREAVRRITGRAGGGVLQPEDACTKTNKPVLQVLQEKHPDMRDVDVSDPTNSAFEQYEKVPAAIPLRITADTVEKVASELSGAAGPGGVDGVTMKKWLLQFGSRSDRLRGIIARLANWLANDPSQLDKYPPWAAIRALMACRLIALDKTPGVHPIGIGEIIRRLISKCIISVVGHQATKRCGNLNLCVGLSAGMEGAIHAVTHHWNETGVVFPTQSTDPSQAPTLMADSTTMDEFPFNLATQPDSPVAEDTGTTTAPVDTLVGIAVDARNAFNELSRRCMLWTTAHLWAAGRRFIFNCYRHQPQLFVRQYGKDCYVIPSREGVTQGAPDSMIVYGLTVSPLAAQVRKEAPIGALSTDYADDDFIVAQAQDVVKVMDILTKHGCRRGYFVEPSKSICICRDKSALSTVQHILQAFNFVYTNGHCLLGGFIGDKPSLVAWLQPKIAAWEGGIRKLAKVARRYPQTAYTAMVKSYQMEWQFLLRVLPPDCKEEFAPLEMALNNVFLPAILDESTPLSEGLRDLLSLSVKLNGLGIPSPVDNAEAWYQTSVKTTQLLTDSLLARADLDVGQYQASAAQARKAATAGRLKCQKVVFDRLRASASPRVQARMDRSKETGAFLTASPRTYNGTVLSKVEWFDNVRIRVGLPPNNLSPICSGCGTQFTVDHAMQCKKGGLVTLRHNDQRSTLHLLCAQAHKPSEVFDEPLIHPGRDSAGNVLPTTPEGGALPDCRGDLAVHGFWEHGTTAIFDIRITDLDAPYQRSISAKKCLARHETEKKKKYLDACLGNCRTFTPLVYSIDGMCGPETAAFGKRLAAKLAEKWQRPYSEVCGYVRSRLSVSLARSTSLLLRGSRQHYAESRDPTWEGGSGLSLYRS